MSAAYRGMPNQVGVPPQYMGTTQMRPMAPVADPGAMHRKRVQNKVPQRAPGEDEEPSGDELDDISARDIAMARYKRNHDYLSEIFTPYSAASVLPPQLDNSHNKEEIQRQIEEQQTLLQDTENEMEQNIKKLQDKAKSYWSLFEKLNTASSIADMDAAKTALAESMSVELVNDSRLSHPVPVPGLQQEPELTPGGLSSYQHSPGQPHHMQQHVNIDQSQANSANNNESNVPKDNAAPGASVNAYQGYHVSNGQGANVESNMSEANNDFFDEMVNTGQDDDNGSVSEYLNTADMDFEISEKEGGDNVEDSGNTGAEAKNEGNNDDAMKQ